GRAAAENALLRGIALRQPARLIARELQRELGIGLEQALTVARTEGLRAAREGQRQIFAASGVVTGWRWVSALTPRTCAMCWAMHGTIHQVDEIFGTHPNCRCTMVPVIRPELLTQPQTFATGAERFARLAGKTQLAILGRKKYNAYAAGDLALSDVVGYRDDPKWGPTRFERSYKSITGGSR
ncbi:MAG TPA: minor capsid protein, partial [Herpetosiphonaceae bacterium]